MKNKLLALGMLVMALTFGMTVIGCSDKDDDSTGPTFEVYTWTEADTGTNITSLLQIKGTWKGSYTDKQEGKVTVYYTFTTTNGNGGGAEYFYFSSNMKSSGGNEIRLSDMNGVQINQDGTKIKLPAGILGFPSEIILKKYSGSIPSTGGQGGEPSIP